MVKTSHHIKGHKEKKTNKQLIIFMKSTEKNSFVLMGVKTHIG